MKFLVTNDDGIDAPGLAVLRQVAEAWGDVSVVAPDQPHSGCSHRVSSEYPICLERRAERQFALNGTPVDCTRIGLTHVAPESDWVFAGVNRGANLGCDVWMSGTVAAVREAALCGRKAIAFSQYCHGRNAVVDWQRSANWVGEVFQRIRDQSLPAGQFWNVNFPDLADSDDTPELVFCPADTAAMELHYERSEDCFTYRAVYQQRPRTPEHDIDVCFGGRISISRLQICTNVR